MKKSCDFSFNFCLELFKGVLKRPLARKLIFFPTSKPFQALLKSRSGLIAYGRKPSAPPDRVYKWR